MNKFFYFAFASCLFIACSKEQNITFTEKTLEAQSNDCLEQTCATVSITYPYIVASDSISHNINKEINRHIIQVLDSDETYNTTLISAEQAVDAFIKDFLVLKEKFPDSSFGYEAMITGSVSYQSKTIISLAVESYMFTGGAHGASNVSFLNFDAQTGLLLDNSVLFSDLEKIKELAETYFRKQENLTPDASLNDAGYWFEENSFHLPASIGLTQNELILHYNPYEIASYADGPKTISIPIEELKNLLLF